MPTNITSTTTVFEADNCQTPEDKNDALAELLTHTWNPYNIVKVARLDQPGRKGWEATIKSN